MPLTFFTSVMAPGNLVTYFSMPSTSKLLFNVSAASGPYFTILSSAVFLSAYLLQLGDETSPKYVDSFDNQLMGY